MNATRLHGGTDADGTVRFDFSTNSNACGPCPEALAAVQAADASRYPDPAYTHLRQALADFHGVPAWRIVLAASASEFIFRISAWLAQQGGQQVWYPEVAYGDYAHAARAWGMQRSPGFDAAQLVWACEPSSPLGQDATEWPSALQQQETFSHALVVLDCAYAPLRLSGQPSLQAHQRERVWQLFSPNKALAMTGVRAAYAIAPARAEALAHALDAAAPSWPVGAHGVALLQAWTQSASQDWLRSCLPLLSDWKARQLQMLQSFGWQCLPSQTNFFCTKPPASWGLGQLLVYLRSRGIKLRDTGSMGLPGHVRLSVQPPAAQAALQSALAQFPAFTAMETPV